MQKEMSRKEFLATMGLGIGSIMGFSTIIHMLTGKSLSHQTQGQKTRSSYGGSSYGGKRSQQQAAARQSVIA